MIDVTANAYENKVVFFITNEKSEASMMYAIKFLTKFRVV